MHKMMLLLRSRPWLQVALVITVVLLLGVVAALVPSCQKRGVVREAQQIAAEHQQAQAKGQAAQNKYQLDSTARATEARGIARRDSSLKAQQHALLQHLSKHPPLPAWDALPSAN